MTRTSHLIAPLFAVLFAALALPGAAQANGRVSGFVAVGGPGFAAQVSGGHGGYWRGGGRGWGGVSIGIGLPLFYGGYPSYGYGYPYAAPYYPYPGTVLVAPPPMAYDEAPVRAQWQPVPAAKAPPEPIIYPRGGQSTAKTEADRQACNRWATTQPSAMADASVFHRATMACMEGRGYTVR